LFSAQTISWSGTSAAEHLEAARRLGMGGFTGGVHGGRQRDGLTEFAAIHLAAVECFDEIDDEFFHAGFLPLVGGPNDGNDRDRR
jgi:hypothetical protein